jgi:Lar family restriction alleviation protein
MTANQIESCPFCGAGIVHLQEIDTDGWAVVCEACGVIGPMGQGKLDATDRWNRRFTLARNLGLIRSA